MSKKSIINPYKKGSFLYHLYALTNGSKTLADVIKKFCINLYHQYIWRKRDNKPRRYKSAKELIASISDTAPYQKLYYRIHGRIQRIVDFPRDTYRAIQRGLQRGYRGWADEDTWCCASYYSKVIVQSIMHLKKVKHGVPMSAFEEADGVDEYGNPTDAATELADKRWEGILDDIVYTFHVGELVMNHDWHYTPSDKWSEVEYKRLNKVWKDCEIKVMSLEECVRYEKGWKLFQEHFFSLWD